MITTRSSGAIDRQSRRGRDRQARPTTTPRTPRNDARPRSCGSAGTSSTTVRARPRTANDPTSRSPSRSNHSSPGSSKRPAICRSPRVRSASCSATRNSRSSSPAPTASRSTSAPPSTGPHARLRRAVLHRDQGRCRYPGCDRTHGQVHHVIAVPRRPHRPREPRLPVRLPPPRPPQTRMARDLRRHHLHRHQPRPPTYRQHLTRRPISRAPGPATLHTCASLVLTPAQGVPNRRGTDDACLCAAPSDPVPPSVGSRAVLTASFPDC